MVLDQEIKAQLQNYLALLEGDLVIKISAAEDQASKDMLELVTELTNMSPRISMEKTILERTPSFSIN